ncbi:hypothetical protein AQZ52_11040 [Novosphingobium fuchskuhlense]|uniref:Uncharacterized protein n=1 Tax=Novosphingobium fuchskuhlense TaxID=1117702 RepID=A0A117UUR1_9SPHN|nr:hypothetical protein [Novosphingobium fuchskuhlense]KUR71198.1 hypothetical protein AQZ52_11040 [Novosphingobium fuchskuhlense]
MTRQMGGNDPAHREAMQEGSATLRDRILAMLAERDGKFSAQVAGHDQARRAIAKGVSREEVMSLFDLSDTAYEQLAGQVRAGAA